MHTLFAKPSLLFDSYVALDPYGPSVSNTSSSADVGYSALGPSNVIRPSTGSTQIFQPDRLTGVWFNTGFNGGFVSSYSTNLPDAGPDDSRENFFIAQITLRPGSSAPTTDGLLVNLRDSGTANPIGAMGLLKFGVGNATNNGGLWGQHYYLEAVPRTVTAASGAFLGGTSYAIFIHAVPSPGVGAWILAGGLWSSRRRRSV